MTNEELRNETRSVREEFDNIPDASIDSDPQITEWKSELEALRANVRVMNERNDRARAVLASLQGKIDVARNGIEQINSQRAEVIATALIEGSDFSGDAELLDLRSDLEQGIERLTIARPALEKRQRSLAREAEIASNPCTQLEDRINSRRDALKLQEARRRHGYA